MPKTKKNPKKRIIANLINKNYIEYKGSVFERTNDDCVNIELDLDDKTLDLLTKTYDPKSYVNVQEFLRSIVRTMVAKVDNAKEILGEPKKPDFEIETKKI